MRYGIRMTGAAVELITSSTYLAVDADANKEDCTRSPIYERGEVLQCGIWDSKLVPTELKYEEKAFDICVKSWVAIPLISISVGDPLLFLLQKVNSCNSFQVLFGSHEQRSYLSSNIFSLLVST